MAATAERAPRRAGPPARRRCPSIASLAAILAAAVGALAAVPSSAQEAAPARPRIVRVDVSRFPKVGVALDPAGIPPGRLDAWLAGLTILEDGRPQPPTTADPRPGGQSLVVLVDVRPEHLEWLGAVSRFLTTLPQHLGRRDLAAVLNVADYPELRPSFLRHRVLRRHFVSVGSPGHAPLVDSLAEAYLACRGREEPTALLVLTTGGDRGSHLLETGLLEMMALPAAPVIGLALGPDADAELLDALASRTGGRSVVVDTQERALDLLPRALAWLDALPTVWYTAADATRDGRFRTLSLRVPGERRAESETSGYFAPASPDVCRSAALKVASAEAGVLRMPYILRRADTGDPVGVGATGRRELIAPGSYTVEILCGGGTRMPWRIPAGEGLLVSDASAYGTLVLAAPDWADGARFEALDSETGRLVAAGVLSQAIPDSGVAQLEPGRYDVRVTALPLEDGPLVDMAFPATVVSAQQAARLDLGSRGALTIVAEDLDGGANFMAPVRVYAPGAAEASPAGEPLAQGVANTPLGLPEGTYDVEVLTKPPVELRSVRIDGGHATERSIARQGAIELSLLDPSGQPAPVSWSAQEGERFVLSGMTNDLVRVLPGTYDLTIDTQPSQTRVCTIAPGETYSQDLGQLAGLAVVLRGLSDEAYLTQRFALLDPATADTDLKTGELDHLTGRRVGNGLTGSRQDMHVFAAGTYDLLVETAPYTLLTGIELPPGRVRTIDLGRSAGLRVESAVPGGFRYVVRRASDGQVAGAYDTGRTVLLRAGAYRVEPVGVPGVAVTEAFAVGGLDEGGALFVDRGTLDELRVSAVTDPGGEALGPFEADRRIDVAPGDLLLEAKGGAARIPDRVVIERGVLTVVPIVIGGQ
jgi:hypothetical protein